MFGPTVIVSPRAPRYLSLDHWRGVACLLVVVFHSTSVFALSPSSGSTAPVSGLDGLAAGILGLLRVGWIGVPIFFVISGYAISATVDSSRRRGGGGRSFFRRRFRRIYPPYWAIIVLQAVVVFAVDVVVRPGMLTGSVAPIERPWEFTPIQWLGNLTLTESWRATVAPFGSPTDYFLGQAWTLCYEEQFYLVAGAALILVPGRYFAAAALVTLATLIAPFASRVTGLPIHGFFFDGHWLMFAAGVLVYWQVNYGSRRTLAGAWAGIGLATAYALTIAPRGGQLGEYLLVGFVFAGLILALHPLDRGIDARRSLRPLHFAGTICYSLYLSHAVIVRSLSQFLHDFGLTSATATLFIVLPLCVAVAVPVAWGFHLLVERRFLSPSAARAAAAAIPIPVPVEPSASGPP